MHLDGIKKKLGDGIIVAVIPIVGSFAAYFYEAGYLSFFYIPNTFIQLDFPRVLRATSWILGISLVIVFYSSVLLGNLLTSRHPIARTFKPIAILGALVIAFAFLAQASNETWLAILIFGLLLIGVHLVPPIFEKGPPYWKRVENHARKTLVEAQETGKMCLATQK